MMDVDTMTPEEIGRIFGMGIVTILLLFGIIKSFMIARRPRTSTLCAVSLGVLFSIWFLSSVMQWLNRSIGMPPLVSVALAFVITVGFIASLVLSIVGLATYSSKYVQGKAQAIWSLVLSSLFAIIIVSAAIVNFQPSANLSKGKSTRELKKFSEHGFTFQMPGRPWAEMNSKVFPEAARLILKKKHPEVYFMIATESSKMLEKFAVEDYFELIKANVEINSEVLEIGNFKKKKAGENVFSNIDFVVSPYGSNKKLSYELYILKKNNCFYRLIAWGNYSDKKVVKSSLESLGKNFHVTKGFKPAKYGKILDLEGDNSYHLKSNLAPLGWSSWPEKSLEEDQGGRLWGAQKGDVAYLTVDALDLFTAKFDEDYLIKAFLARSSIKREDEALQIREIEQAEPRKAWDITYRNEVENVPYLFRMRMLRYKGKVCYITSWILSTLPDAEKELAKALDSFEILDKRARTPQPTSPKKFSKNTFSKSFLSRRESHPSVLEQKGFIMNDAGLAALAKNDFNNAAKYLKQAYDFYLSDPVILTNVFEVHASGGTYEKGLEYLEQNQDKHPENMRVKIYKAFFEAKTGNWETAAKLYSSYLKQEEFTEQDLQNALNLFAGEDKYDEAIKLALSYLEGKSSLKVQEWLANIYAHSGDEEKCIELLELITSKENVEVSAWYLLAEAYIRSGHYNKSEEITKRLFDEGYDNARLISIQGWCEYQRGWYQQARETYEAGLKDFPNDEGLKSSLQATISALGKSNNYIIKNKLEPIPLPKSIKNHLENYQKKLEPKKEKMAKQGSYYDFLLMGTEYEENKNQRYSTRASIKIMDNSGVNKYSTLSFKFNPTRERVFLGELKVMDENGKVVSEGEINNYFTTSAQDGNIVDGSLYLNAPVPGLQVGNTIQYCYTRETKSQVTAPKFERYVMSQEIPFAIQAVYFIGEKEHLKFSKNKFVTSHSGEECLYWTVHDQPAYRWESMQPDITEFLPYVILGPSNKSWEEEGKEYLQFMSSRFGKNKGKIKELAEKISKKTADKKEQLSEAIAYVRKNITYKALEFGIRGRLPNLPGKTLSDKYGDCKDQSLLLHQILKELGIKSDLALVNTSWQVEPKLESLDQFDHMIVYLPEHEGGTYIDCTDENVPALYPYQPDSPKGNKALILQPETQKVRLANCPRITHFVEKIYSKRTIKKAETSSEAQVEESIELHGVYASYLRSFLKSISKSDWSTRTGRLISWGKNLNIQTMEVTNLEDNEKPLKVAINYIVKDVFPENQTKGAIAIPSPWEVYYLQPSPINKRKNPFRIKRKTKFESDIYIQTQANKKHLSQKAQHQENDFFKLAYKVGIKPEEKELIHINYKLQRKNGTYSPQRYKDYENSVDKALKPITELSIHKSIN